jgi:Uma2 family endonuclease
VATRVPRSYTVADLDELDADDDRVEIIDGELVREATSFEHGDAQTSLVVEIKGRFRGRGPDGGEGWWLASEVDVVYAANQVFRHDVAGWRKSRVPVRPVGKRVTTRPDWVCEILSTNRNKDLRDKRAVLHAHGVPHYWIVDLEAPLLTVLRHHADGYLIVTTCAPGEVARLEPFDSVELEVARLFGDIG